MREFTPEDAIERDKMLCDTISACTEALALALPYLTPLAAKNSAKGDEAMVPEAWAKAREEMLDGWPDESSKTSVD